MRQSVDREKHHGGNVSKSDDGTVAQVTSRCSIPKQGACSIPQESQMSCQGSKTPGGSRE